MKPAYTNRKLVALFFIVVGVTLLTGVANAQSIAPRSMRCLVGAVEPGKEVELIRVRPNVENEPFVVPAGYSFVLTDVIVSPQLLPPDGWYSWGIVPSGPNFTTAFAAQSLGSEPSSLRVHLHTGLVFRAGSRVRFGLASGPSSVNVYAYGYLAKDE